jgi:hypothetical protein
MLTCGSVQGSRVTLLQVAIRSVGSLAESNQTVLVPVGVTVSP